MHDSEVITGVLDTGYAAAHNTYFIEMGNNLKFWVHVRFGFCEQMFRVRLISGSSSMELEMCFPGGHQFNTD